MKRFFRSAAALILALLLLTSCSLLPGGIGGLVPGGGGDGPQAGDDPAGDQTPQPIRVAGLDLLSFTEYTVLLEPTEYCTPGFPPVCVQMVFESANYCHLTYEGQTVDMGRFTNDLYIDLFTTGDDPSEELAFNGKCDRDCEGADFAVRVQSLTQGENAVRLFGIEPVPRDWEIRDESDEEPEQPMVFRAGSHEIVQKETYHFLIKPDGSCDKEFEPFTIPIRFMSEISVWYVTDQYKNRSSVVPGTYAREDSGWIEFRYMSRGSFWGVVSDGEGDADLTFLVIGLDGDLSSLFGQVTALPTPVPTPEPTPEPTAVPTPEPLKPADLDTEIYLYYASLDYEEKVVYTQLLRAIEACEDTVEPAYPMTNNDIFRILTCVKWDQPQLFWSDWYRPATYGSGNSVTRLSLRYNDLASGLKEKQDQVESAVSRLLDEVRGMDVKDAERHVHDALATETEYVGESPFNQEIYSTFVNHQTVCAGYARAFQYVMQRLGVPCCYCTGEAGSGDSVGRHAWNLVKIGGNWYNMDLTWNDYRNESGRSLDYISYEFYNVTDRFISEEHRRDEHSAILPECTSESASFDALFGQGWKAEAAEEMGVPFVRTLKDYEDACYDALMKKGSGTVTVNMVFDSKDVYDEVALYNRNGEFKSGYLKRFQQDSGIGNFSYGVQFLYAMGMSPRGECIWLGLEHKVTK